MIGQQPYQLPPLPRTNLQDTAAESKEPVIFESDVIGVFRFAFLFPFIKGIGQDQVALLFPSTSDHTVACPDTSPHCEPGLLSRDDPS